MASSRALTTTSYSLMKLLSPMNASPVLVRSLRTCTRQETSSDSDSDTPTSGSDSEQPPPRAKVCPLVNRFLKEGPAIPYFVHQDDKAMFARLNMPGIGKEGLKLWVEDNALCVRGVASEPFPMKYSGKINIRRGRYKVEEIKAELKNGVLLIGVPKIKLEDRQDVINVKVK